MTVPRTVRWGVGLALVAACVSGLSIYLNGLYVKEFPDQTLLAAVRNSLVGLALVGMLVAGRRTGELRDLPARRRLGLLAIGVVGGGIAFALFFTGLALTTAPGAALIQKTLFVWVALLAVVFLGERLGLAQILGMGALLAGTLLLTPGSLAAGPGEALILVATLLWALEVLIAKRVLGEVRTLPAATARMVIGGLVLLGIVLFNGHLGQLAAWTPRQWTIVLGTGALLCGYVVAWYGALRRAPASVVTSVLVVGAVITSGLQAVTAGKLPDGARTGGLALLAVGTILIVLAAAGWWRTHAASTLARAADG
jgi:drug/metabolite transporter (DMT)-like permease